MPEIGDNIVKEYKGDEDYDYIEDPEAPFKRTCGWCGTYDDGTETMHLVKEYGLVCDTCWES